MQRYFASERRFEPLAQLAIKFALAPNAVSSAIPGMKTPAHATDNLGASDIPDFTREQLAWLTSAE